MRREQRSARELEADPVGRGKGVDGDDEATPTLKREFLGTLVD